MSDRATGQRRAAGAWRVAITPVVALALAAAPGHAADPANEQRIHRSDSELVREVTALAVRNGVAPPYGSGPYSEAELEQTLRRIDDLAGLSSADRELYESVRRRLKRHPVYESDGSLVVDVSPRITAEAYLNLQDPSFPWLYGHEEREPLLDLPVEAWIEDGAYAFFGVDLRKNYPDYRHYVSDKNPDTVNPDPWGNVYSHRREIDVQFPHRGFLSIGGDHWNLQFGRDKLSWGYARTGALFISDYADYHDYLRLVGFWESFKFSTFWLSLEPWLLAGEDPGARDLHKSFLAHRFDFRLFNRLNLSYTEAIMFGRDDLELRYLNPFVSFHNWFVNVTLSNALMSFEAEATLAPGLLGYAGFLIDQWSAPVEVGDYTQEEPNAFGYLLGLDWRFPFPSAGRSGYLHLNGEWVRTDPWTYIGLYPHISFTTRRRVQAENALPPTKVLVDKPLGHPGGPDYTLGSVLLEYETPGAWRAGIVGTLGRKGENTVDKNLPPRDADDALRVTPSGDHPETMWSIGLSGEVAAGPERWEPAEWLRARELGFGSELSFVWLENRGSVERATEFDLQWVGWTSISW